jgi:hypothetical protein
MTCPSNIELTQFLDNQTEAEGSEIILDHLKSCPSCRSRVEDLENDFQLLEKMRDVLNPFQYPEPFIDSIPLRRSPKKERKIRIPSFKIFKPGYITVFIGVLAVLLISLLIPPRGEIDKELSGVSSGQTMPKVLIMETNGVPSDSIIIPDKTRSRLIVWVCKKNKET